MELINKVWLGIITSFFLVIYRVLLWHQPKELERCMTISPVMLFLPSSICTLVQQTNWSAYYSTKVLLSVLSKTDLAGIFSLLCLRCYLLKMADFYCACIMPRFIIKLYSVNSAYTHFAWNTILPWVIADLP